MANYSVIYSADYDFQVLSIIRDTADKAWIVANELFRGNKNPFIIHYDVVWFASVDEMNDWIIEQVNLSRE